MEREGLGDNLPPDFITRIRKGDFFGWPWYYAGGNQDPRYIGKHPELKDKVTIPDVLIPAHNAIMGLGFYDGSMFPAEYQGDLFAAVHGSWNRSVRAGYELIRVPLIDGRPSGVFQDFMTGFTTDDAQVWGRPVGVAAGKDGALYVTDDGLRGIWRISYAGKP
jgi:glucose/arabinose dehydrogenase